MFRYDATGSGSIPVVKLEKLLPRFNICIPQIRIGRWMEERGKDVDGELSFDEFYAMYQRIHSVPDLREEFYEAKYGEYVPLRKPSIDQLFLTPTQLQRFFLAASNGEDIRSESGKVK